MVFCACLGDSECGGEHCLGEELLDEVPLGDSSDTDLSEDEPPGDLSATPADAIVPAEAGTRPPPCTYAFFCVVMYLAQLTGNATQKQLLPTQAAGAASGYRSDRPFIVRIFSVSFHAHCLRT